VKKRQAPYGFNKKDIIGLVMRFGLNPRGIAFFHNNTYQFLSTMRTVNDEFYFIPSALGFTYELPEVGLLVWGSVPTKFPPRKGEL
jgi:hypothetical protein